MKVKKEYLAVLVVVLLAFVVTYFGNSSNCNIWENKTKSFQDTVVGQEKSTPQAALFIGCNGFF